MTSSSSWSSEASINQEEPTITVFTPLPACAPELLKAPCAESFESRTSKHLLMLVDGFRLVFVGYSENQPLFCDRQEIAQHLLHLRFREVFDHAERGHGIEGAQPGEIRSE